MVRSCNIAPDSNCKLFIAVTMESDKISTKSSSVEDFPEIKLEPDDINDSMVDVSEGIENNSENSELLRNVGVVGLNVSGTYYYKML